MLQKTSHTVELRLVPPCAARVSDLSARYIVSVSGSEER